MSAELDKAKARARLKAASQPQVDLAIQVNAAFDRIQPGEFGEPAVAGEASIEQFATTGDHIPIKLFVQDSEESVDYSPEQLRELAFNLLVMAEVSEALYEQSGSGS